MSPVRAPSRSASYRLPNGEHFGATSGRKVYALGKKFMGADAVLRQRIHENPDTTAPRRKLSPTFAAIDKFRRMELSQITTEFRRAHKAAMDEWRTGNRDVVFPYGTYKVRVVHKARIAEA